MSNKDDRPAEHRGLSLLLGLRLTHDDRLAVQLLSDLLRSKRWLLGLGLAALVGAAVCEGSTMGLLALALSTLADSGTQSLTPSLGSLGRWINRWQQAWSPNQLFLLFVVLAVLNQLLRSGLQFASTAITAGLHAQVEGEVRAKLTRRFLQFSQTELARYSVGNLHTYGSESAAAGKVLQQLNAILGQALLAVASVAVLCWLSWPLTLLVLAAMGLLSFGVRRVIRKIRSMGERYSRQSVALQQRSYEVLSNLRLVRLFAREQYMADQVDEAVHRSISTNRRLLVWHAAIGPVVECSAVLGAALFLLIGYLWLGSDSPHVLPRLTTFVVILYRLMPRISHLNNARASLGSHWPMLVRVSNMLYRQDIQLERTGGQPFHTLQTGIEFRNVWLRYAEDQPWALEDLSFVLPRGKLVALVGGSGAGKSSVADLLLGLYEPTRGEILIDGVSLQQLNLTTWRQQLGVVDQHTCAFHASLRENILFGKLDATAAELASAVQAAQLEEFVQQLPAGLDTVIGERGSQLSGGQLQRMAIARALLRNPQILILDEATSSLDTHSERLIQASLSHLSTHRTVLSIAHRLSTISHADHILVLSHPGPYSHLWHAQSHTPG